jgi:DNA-binding CsgD family transcriptional regulator
MTNLQPLFQAIPSAQTEQELRSQLIPALSQYFAATRCGLFFFDRLPPSDRNLSKLVQIALSTEHNPVLRYIVERHAPVHEALVTSPKAWRLICPRADHWHVMAGPLVCHGQLVGGVGFTRQQGMPAFNSQNLIDVSALCLHLSTWVAARSPSHKESSSIANQPGKTHQGCLTPREMQIVELVAKGRTNAEIGVALWITENSVKQALKRMFRKLEVCSRAEMIAQLAATTL